MITLAHIGRIIWIHQIDLGHSSEMNYKFWKDFRKAVREANPNAIVLVNNNDYEITKEVLVWDMGVPRECVMERLLLTTAEGFVTEKVEYPVVSGKVIITLSKTSAIILKHRKKILWTQS